MNKYEYPAEKFDNARKFLERSRTEGDVILIADAFRECRTALFQLDKLNVDYLDDGVIKALGELKELMDTTGLDNRPDLDLNIVKAKLLTPDQKVELSGVINYLANWFDTKSGE